MAYPSIQTSCANLLLSMMVFEYSKGEVGDLQQINRQWNKINARETHLHSTDHQTQLVFEITLKNTHLFFQKYPSDQRSHQQLNQCEPSPHVAMQTSIANMILSMAIYECSQSGIKDLEQISYNWDQIYPYEKHINPLDRHSQFAFNAAIKKVESFFQRHPLPQSFLPPLNQQDIFRYVLKQKIEAIAERARELGIISFFDGKTDHLTGYFGNFHICSQEIKFEDKYYSNAEAIFQAQKQKGNPHIFKLFDTNTDGDAAVQLGQSLLSQYQVQEWDLKKNDVMMNCLRAKFDQNPYAKNLLMATRNAYLVKHLPFPHDDYYWGDGYDGSGKNNLGICLMKLRAEYGGTDVVLRPHHNQQLLEKFYTKFYAKNAS